MPIDDEARKALQDASVYQRMTYGSDGYRERVKFAISVECELLASQKRELRIIEEQCISWPSNRRGVQ